MPGGEREHGQQGGSTQSLCSAKSALGMVGNFLVGSWRARGGGVGAYLTGRCAVRC